MSQFYDQHLASCGLRTTQFSILAKLRDAACPLTINRLAELIVMDRTTLGRNILPLQREGLLVTARNVDRRSKEVSLTNVGLRRLEVAWTYWAKAQARFDAAFGSAKDLKLRALMRDVTSTELVYLYGRREIPERST